MLGMEEYRSWQYSLEMQGVMLISAFVAPSVNFCDFR